MSTDRSFGQALASVTVVLVDGQSHTGQLARFAPATLDLAITTVNAATAGTEAAWPCTSCWSRMTR